MVSAVRTAALAVGALVLTGCTLQVDGAGTGATTSGAPAPAPTGLTIGPESHANSYDRAAFGQRWKDTDRNGCGQRDDVLARDLTAVQRRGRCVVVAGALTDPYTGQEVTFTKARAADVQIDHIVALADAWRSGAWAWAPGRREAFANDLTELQATAAAVNSAKSDHDAASWTPTGPRRACTWAHTVIAIKARWQLTVDQAEAAALTRMLRHCSA